MPGNPPNDTPVPLGEEKLCFPVLEPGVLARRDEFMDVPA
jgi:hypothetical protein